MTVLPFDTLSAQPRDRSNSPNSEVGSVPAWVWELPGISTAPVESLAWRSLGHDNGLVVRTIDEAMHGLISVSLPGARLKSYDEFSDLTERAYGVVLDTLTELKATFPVRMWNAIPGILEPLGGLDHRYMVFNQSRFRAFSQRSGNRFESSLPTATGVGNLRDNDDLAIHCLTAAEPGTPLENPRQVPAYRYSERFGPRPPCFSRATALNISSKPNGVANTKLLIGGTASVRGEESHHRGDLDAQLDETELNLRALAALITGSRSDWQGDFEHLRVYHRRPEDRDHVERFVRQTFPTTGMVEYFSVDICREELLVEIEGVFAPKA